MTCQSVIGVISMILSIIAFITSVYVFCKSKREKTYADLDTLYLELLKLAMQHPDFVNPSYTVDYANMFKDKDLWKYKTYAYIAWNICETIYDRRDDILFETWHSVIFAENKLHRKWFDNPENYHKFKDSFREYIRNNFPQEYKTERNAK